MTRRASEGAAVLASGVVAGACAWLLSGALLTSSNAELDRLERRAVRESAHALARRVERELARFETIARAAGAFASTRPDLSSAMFATFGDGITNDTRDLLFVGLYRDDVLAFAHPLAPARNALGAPASALGDEELAAIADARANDRTVLAGPFKSPAGEALIAFRAPVFVAGDDDARSGRYWGFATATFDASVVERWLRPERADEPSLRVAVVPSPAGRGFTRASWGDAEVASLSPEKAEIDVAGERWTLSALPRAGWAAPVAALGHGVRRAGAAAGAGALGLGVAALVVSARRARGRLRGADSARARLAAAWDRSTRGLLLIEGGRVTRANDAAARLLKVEGPGDLMGRRAADILPGDGGVEREGAVAEVQRRTGMHRTRWVVHGEGDPRTLDVALVALPELDPPAVLAECRDVSATRRAELDLLARERLLASIIEKAPVGIGLADGEGRVRRLNPTGVAMLGYGAMSEVVGKGAAELVHRDDQHLVRVAPSERMADLRMLEVRMVKKDGAPVLADIRSAALGGREAGRVFTFLDLSLHTERWQRVEAERAAAEEAARLKDQILSNVSHELRTPMNAVLGMSFLVLRTPLDREQRDYVNKIRSAAQILLNLLNDLLDFGKIEAGKIELEEIAFEVDEVLERVEVLAGESAVEKGLELWLERDAAVPPRLTGDPLRIGQVLVNLVSNAIKFSESGEIGVRIEVAGKEGERTRLRFSVRDDGPGVAPELRETIFEAFRQGDSSTSRRFGGFGLGLSIAKRLVEQMEGTIGVDSEPDRGSTFWFTVPLAPADHGPDSLRRSMTRAEFKGRRALVVDDSEAVRRVIGNLLRTMGFDVVVAAGGEEGLAMLHVAQRLGRPFSVVLVDRSMPGMDGPTFLREARADAGLQTPPAVLMVQSRTPEASVGRDDRASVASVMGKPASASSVFDAVSGALSLPSSAPPPAGAPMLRGGAELSGIRVLVVEDNALNQQVAQELLALAGAVVEMAADGEAALHAASHGRFDIVLMDLQMPGMSGFEATARLLADPRHAGLPIVAMTAHAKIEDRERSLSAGMVDHVTKPIDPRELYAVVRRHARPRKTSIAPPPPPPAPPLRLPPSPSLPRSAPPPPSEGIDGVDMVEASGRIEDRPLLERLLRDFATSWADGAARVRGELERGERLAAANVAHALRGVAANLAVTEVCASCARLEELLREEPESDPAAELDVLERELSRAVDSIRGALGP